MNSKKNKKIKSSIIYSKCKLSMTNINQKLNNSKQYKNTGSLPQHNPLTIIIPPFSNFSSKTMDKSCTIKPSQNIISNPKISKYQPNK